MLWLGRDGIGIQVWAFPLLNRPDIQLRCVPPPQTQILRFIAKTFIVNNHKKRI